MIRNRFSLSICVNNAIEHEYRIRTIDIDCAWLVFILITGQGTSPHRRSIALAPPFPQLISVFEKRQNILYDFGIEQASTMTD